MHTSFSDDKPAKNKSLEINTFSEFAKIIYVYSIFEKDGVGPENNQYEEPNLYTWPYMYKFISW